MPKSWYRIRNAGNSGEATVYVYNDIGLFGITADRFAQEMAAIDADTINLRINSCGGEVFAGLAMFNAIRNHPAHVIAHVDGIAASAATLPMLAADEIRIASNGYVMIHNPLVEWASGDAAQLRKQADVLDSLGKTLAKIYADRTGGDIDELTQQMDDETWLNADQAVAAGFADAVADESDDVPANPKNRVRKYLNRLQARARVRPGAQMKASAVRKLLAEIAQAPARAGKDRRMNTKDKRRALARKRLSATAVAAAALAAAAVWPDAADVRQGVTYGPEGDDYTGTLVVDDETAEEETPPAPSNKGKGAKAKATASAGTPATVAEIKAAFKDDPAFALERADKSATMIEHKAAYADHLKKSAATNQGEISRLRAELAKHNPALAGHSGPLNTGVEGSGGGDGGSGDIDKPASPLAAARAKRIAQARK